jgi:hypothetical protein
MDYSVDPWDPSYGQSVEGDTGLGGSESGGSGSGGSESGGSEGGGDDKVKVTFDVETAIDSWAPVSVAPVSDSLTIVFIDGVRRVDARIWVRDTNGKPHPAIAASWAAGAVVVADRQATVSEVEVGHGIVTAWADATDVQTVHGLFEAVKAKDGSPESLSSGLQQAMNRTEIAVATRAAAEAGANLVVVDGPLRGRDHLTGGVGLVKTHHVAYLEGRSADVLGALEPGQRTPVFLIGGTGAGGWVRYSWYVRLPGAGRSPLAGVVRCEAPGRLELDDVIDTANLATAVLPRFASEPHKDARAPQNLYPIAGLERQLRHRLGDARLMYRALLRGAT